MSSAIPPPPASIQNSGKPFVVHGSITVKAGHGDAFVTTIKKAQELSLLEKDDVLVYNIGRNAEEDKRDTFYFYEKYTSFTGFKAHLAGEGFGKLIGSGLMESSVVHYVEEM